MDSQRSGPSLRSSGVRTSTAPLKRRRKRRTASVGSLSVKPTLTERQQLQLAMQLSSPVSSPVSFHEDKSMEKSKLSKRNDRGETLLHCACIRGDFSAVVSLIDNGADIHATDNAQWTPLHEAANHGFVDIVKYLLDHGADIQANGHDNTTPLHDAVCCGHYKIVSLLVQYGADPEKKNSQGVSPLAAAKDDGDNRMVSILKNLGDPGEDKSLKGTPRKSQQFAVHEKLETPKKMSCDVFSLSPTSGGLVVSVPLDSVKVKKCLFGDFKEDSLLAEEDDNFSTETEKSLLSNYEGNVRKEVAEGTDVRGDDILGIDKLETPPQACEEDSGSQQTVGQIPDVHLSAGVREDQNQSEKHSDDPMVHFEEQPTLVGSVEESSMLSPGGNKEAHTTEEQHSTMQDIVGEYLSASEEFVGRSSDTKDEHPANTEKQLTAMETLQEPSADVEDKDTETAVRNKSIEECHETSSPFCTKQSIIPEKDKWDSDSNKNTIQPPTTSFEHKCESDQHSGVLEESESHPIRVEEDSKMPLGLKDSANSLSEAMQGVEQSTKESKDTGHSVQMQVLTEQPLVSEGCGEKPAEVKEQPNHPMILNVPPDHTYCGQPGPGYVPPPMTGTVPDSGVVNTLHSSFECLLHAAEGSYLSSKSSTKTNPTASVISSQKPVLGSDQKHSGDESVNSAHSSVSRTASTEDSAQLSFPVSLKFCRRNTTKSSSTTSLDSPAEDPLFSLATIATGSSHYQPSSSKSMQGHLLTPMTSRSTKSSTVTHRGSKTMSLSQSSSWTSDSSSMLPPKKRFRPVMSSDVVCQRQTYSSGNVDYSYLDEFLTLSRSQSALLPVSCGPEQAQEQDNPDNAICALIRDQEVQLKELNLCHLREQERLLIHLESELIRAHMKVNASQPPPSVCSYLMEKLRPTERKCGPSNSITELTNNIAGDHSEDKEQDGAYLERKHKLLQSYVTDVWDKVYVLKTQMCQRQNEELLNLKREHKEAFISMIKNVL